MLLVTGGWGNRDLRSTEVYRPSTGKWREVPGGALPWPRYGVRVVTLNNRVLLFGEEIILICFLSLIACTYVGGEDDLLEHVDNEHAEILEYSEGKWTSVGEMSIERSHHGVSIIDFDKFKDHCRQ